MNTELIDTVVRRVVTRFGRRVYSVTKEELYQEAWFRALEAQEAASKMPDDDALRGYLYVTISRALTEYCWSNTSPVSVSSSLRNKISEASASYDATVERPKSVYPKSFDTLLENSDTPEALYFTAECQKLRLALRKRFDVAFDYTMHNRKVVQQYSDMEDLRDMVAKVLLENQAPKKLSDQCATVRYCDLTNAVEWVKARLIADFETKELLTLLMGEGVMETS